MVRVIFYISPQFGTEDFILVKAPRMSHLDKLGSIPESIKKLLPKEFFNGRHYEAELEPCCIKDECFDFNVFSHYKVTRIRTCGVKRWRYI